MYIFTSGGKFRTVSSFTELSTAAGVSIVLSLLKYQKGPKLQLDGGLLQCTGLVASAPGNKARNAVPETAIPE